MRVTVILTILATSAIGQVGIQENPDLISGNVGGDTFLDLGHNPDLGLTTTWTGTPAVRGYFVDTSTIRSKWLTDWENLKALDIGNNVATNGNIGFSGGAVRHWYVSTTGSDTTGDGSKGDPWATLDHAYNQVPASPSQNYQINIARGVYQGGTIDLSGKDNAPYYVRIVGEGRPVLTYNQAFIDAAISSAEGAGYTFGEDTEPTDADHYDPVISIDDENVEVRGLRIIGARNLLPQFHFSECGIWLQATRLGPGEKIIIADCEISQVGHVAIKGGDDGGDAIVVDGNFLHDNGHTRLDHHVYPTGSAYRIRRNLFVNSSGLGVNGNTANRYDYTISHNIFIGNQNGVALSGKDWTVIHNVFFGNNYSGLFLYRTGINGYVANNVFYENVATVTSQRASIYDTGGTRNRLHLAFDWEYNYVESGSGVVPLTTDPVAGVELWAAETDYTGLIGRVYRTPSNRYYELRVAPGKSGASEPTAESAWTTDITDGDNALRYMGTSLPQNTYTNTTTGDDSSGAVFVDAAAYNFKIKTGADGDGAGTDLGYDNGDLPGVWLTTK